MCLGFHFLPFFYVAYYTIQSSRSLRQCAIVLLLLTGVATFCQRKRHNARPPPSASALCDRTRWIVAWRHASCCFHACRRVSACCCCCCRCCRRFYRHACSPIPRCYRTDRSILLKITTASTTTPHNSKHPCSPITSPPPSTSPTSAPSSTTSTCCAFPRPTRPTPTPHFTTYNTLNNGSQMVYFPSNPKHYADCTRSGPPQKWLRHCRSVTPDLHGNGT